MAGQRPIMAGCTADQMDCTIICCSIVGICGEHGGEIAGLGEVGEVQAVGEAGEAPGLAVSVKPYIIV